MRRTKPTARLRGADVREVPPATFGGKARDVRDLRTVPDSPDLGMGWDDRRDFSRVRRLDEWVCPRPAGPIPEKERSPSPWKRWGRAGRGAGRVLRFREGAGRAGEGALHAMRRSVAGALSRGYLGTQGTFRGPVSSKEKKRGIWDQAGGQPSARSNRGDASPVAAWGRRRLHLRSRPLAPRFVRLLSRISGGRIHRLPADPGHPTRKLTGLLSIPRPRSGAGSPHR